MTDATQSGKLLLDSLLQFLEKGESEVIRGTLTVRLHPRALEYLVLRLQILQDLRQLRQLSPVEFFRGAFADVNDYTQLQKLQNIFGSCKRLCIASTKQHLRDPTRVNLVPFNSLTYLELRSCDLSTSAWLGFQNVNSKLESLTCIGCLEELQHLLAPSSSSFYLKDGPDNGENAWPCLKELICKQNSLADMTEALRITSLRKLDLSSNNITAIQNLQECTQLTELNLSHNSIQTLLPLREGPKSLSRLILQGNAIKTVRGISMLTALTELDLRCNLLASYQDFNQVQDLVQLRKLWMEGNPLAYAPFYRLDVLSWFPGPGVQLDGISTRKEEREAVGLRSAGQIPLAWKVMADYVGQQELLWHPPKQANSTSQDWRAGSLRASPARPTIRRQRRLSSKKTVPARRIVEFSGDPLADLEDSLERPSSPSPFHPANLENFETASLSSTTSGVHPRTLGGWGSRHVQTVYRERPESNNNLPSVASSKNVGNIPDIKSFLTLPSLQARDTATNTPREGEELQAADSYTSSSLSVSDSSIKDFKSLHEDD